MALDAAALDRVFVAFGDEGVVSVGFAHHAAEYASIEPATATPAYLDPLVRYLAGEEASLDAIPLSLSGTAFQQKVWAALRTIRRGHVVSYAHIAKAVGVPRGMRAVGMANGRNPVPIIVPCHRVVEASGALGGFSGGLDTKRKLLALEGVQLVHDHVLPGQRRLFPD